MKNINLECMFLRLSNWSRERIGLWGPWDPQFENESPVDRMGMSNGNWQNVNCGILTFVSESLRCVCFWVYSWSPWFNWVGLLKVLSEITLKPMICSVMMICCLTCVKGCTYNLMSLVNICQYVPKDCKSLTFVKFDVFSCM